MLAAVAQSCIVCRNSSSKYKCPTCKSPTCSLDCAKKHAGETHPAPEASSTGAIASTSYSSRAESAINSTASQADGTLPPLRLRNETVEAPPSHRFEKVGKYVSMKEYDARQMLEDFEYLQYVGKCVGKVGNEIVKNGWLQEMEDRAAASASAAAAKNAANGSGGHQHEQARNQRGGMDRGRGRGGRGGSPGGTGTNRQQYQNIPAEIKNRQAFESLIRRMKLPIMLLPDGMTWRKENQMRWKNNTKQLLCSVEVRSAASSTSNVVAAAKTTSSLLHHIPWDREISSIVIKDLEKRLKVRGEDSQEAITILLQKSSDEKGRLPSTWKDLVCITISVANDRLRNESSSKFLEWWQRQVKNGMVKADGLQLDEEKRTALEEMRRGVWSAIEGIDASGTPQQQDTLQETVAAEKDTNAKIEEQQMMVEANAGLISASFLSRLQASRAKKDEQEEEASRLQHSKASAPPLPSFGPKRQVIIIDGAETFQDVLQSLPKGLAILEFFHIEIWERASLAKQIESGKVIREHLQGREKTSLESLKRPLHTDESKTVLPAIKKSRTEPSGSKALSSLTAYASSSEGEEEGEEDGEGGGAPEVFVPVHDQEEASDEGDLPSISSTLSGLAEIARSLGMVPSESPS